MKHRLKATEGLRQGPEGLSEGDRPEDRPPTPLEGGS